MSDLSPVQFYLRGREKRRKRLLDGDALPTSSTMLEGLPPTKGDPLASLRAVAILNRKKMETKYPDYAVLLDRFHMTIWI